MNNTELLAGCIEPLLRSFEDPATLGLLTEKEEPLCSEMSQ